MNFVPFYQVVVIVKNLQSNNKMLDIDNKIFMLVKQKER